MSIHPQNPLRVRWRDVLRRGWWRSYTRTWTAYLIQTSSPCHLSDEQAYMRADTELARYRWTRKEALMADPTTQGFEADPEDVQALLDNLVGDSLAEHDPVIRYTMLSKDLVLYDALVSRIADERARTVAAMSSPGGMSYADIAEALNMSRPRAQQLVKRGSALRAAFARVGEASSGAAHELRRIAEAVRQSEPGD